MKSRAVKDWPIKFRYGASLSEKVWKKAELIMEDGRWIRGSEMEMLVTLPFTMMPIGIKPIEAEVVVVFV